MQLGTQFEVAVSLINPLPIQLNYSRFVIEGAGLGQPLKIGLPDPVGPGEDVCVVVKMTAVRIGRKTFVAKFYSKELNDVDGYLNLDVVNRA